MATPPPPPYRTVNIVTSGTPLLSGGLDECFSADDPSCSGGISSVMAYARNYTLDEPLLFVQAFDKQSPFVNMHPLEWVVNRLILHDLFQLKLFVAKPSMLLQNNVDSSVSPRDITELQIEDMPMLMSNVAVPLSNSWSEFMSLIHFDDETNIALLNIVQEAEPFPVSQIEAAIAGLNYIHLVNQRNGCYSTTDTKYAQYANAVNSNFTNIIFDDNNKETTTIQSEQCWVSVILYGDSEARYYKFLDAVSVHDNPPGLVINIEPEYETVDTPQLYKDTNVWIGHCEMNHKRYCQHVVTYSNDKQSSNFLQIQNVTFVLEDARKLPDELKDDLWGQHISYLRRLADDAEANNPVIGFTGEIPVHRIGTYRTCEAGECAVGNLFSDAMRWRTKSDIAFATSGGFRGPGKPAGGTTFTDLYDALPFTNTICTGTMTGISLFQMLNYSTSIATFEGENSDDGGRLLQVSGMKIVYNTELYPSRLISVDVWDEQNKIYSPLDRLQLYKFATDSYVCGGYDPYPDFTGGNFVIDGEVPGQIGDLVVQNVVAEYLSSLDEPWDSSIQGRLVNDTSAFEILNLVQTQDSCPPKTAWDETTFTCIPCPQYSFVSFSDERLELQATIMGETIQTGRVLLSNRESYGIAVFPKSIPSWMEINSATIGSPSLPTSVDMTADALINLESGESLILDFNVFSSRLGSGTDKTALGTVAFGVEDGGSYPGCIGQDATFDVELRVVPPEQLNQLGWIRYVGFGLVFIIIATASIFSYWVYYYRQTRVVKVMQPLFLFTVALGVVILSLGIIPISLDDEIITTSGCDIACMASPWLLSIGFCMSFSALFSKLWRINKLFGGRSAFRRIIVRQKDVLAPFITLFTANVAVLLCWTFIDPLRWQRVAASPNEPWNTFGTCRGRGVVSTILTFLLTFINIGAMILACHQAYKARNISNEFSESTYIGIAIYGWVQFLIVGLPVLFLIDQDNPTASYFLQVSIIFLISISMLLIIFVPPFFNYQKQKGSESVEFRTGSATSYRGSNRARRVTVSGLGGSSAELAAKRQGIVSFRHGDTFVPNNNEREHPREYAHHPLDSDSDDSVGPIPTVVPHDIRKFDAIVEEGDIEEDDASSEVSESYIEHVAAKLSDSLTYKNDPAAAAELAKRSEAESSFHEQIVEQLSGHFHVPPPTEPAPLVDAASLPVPPQSPVASLQSQSSYRYADSPLASQARERKRIIEESVKLQMMQMTKEIETNNTVKTNGTLTDFSDSTHSGPDLPEIH